MSQLEGRTAIVTGANTGIGRVTALELARKGAEVVLACRSEEKATEVVDELKELTGNSAISFLKLDLGSLASVRSAAEEFLASDRPIHLLINNAGLAGTPGLTSDGFELAFGVNHLGHFLFTELLRERIVNSAPGRIVNVSSKAHYKAKSLDWDSFTKPTATLTGLREYEMSKLANVLHAAQLARLLEGTQVTTYSLHPGVVASDVWRRVPWPFRAILKMRMISNDEGARTTLHCATSEAVAEHSGRYYDKCAETPASALATQVPLAEELWSRSAKWAGL